MIDPDPMNHPFADYARTLQPHLDSALAARIAALLPNSSAGPGKQLHKSLCGGKKIRGTILCLTAEACGGDRRQALSQAVAVELVQAASLIHDDVVDRDTLRRGAPAVWSLVGARQAVLVGDVLFASAIEDLSRLRGRHGEVISHAIARIAEGALSEPLDPSALADAVESGQFSEDTYTRIIAMKTGVLFGAACLLGALAAGADEGLQDRALRFGKLLGEAYQLADDLEDFQRLFIDGAREPERLASLAPPLLCLGKEFRPSILALLRGHSLSSLERQGLLRSARDHLNTRIHRRTDAAVEALGNRFPDTPFAQALRSAPREVIRQFLDEESRRGVR